MAMGETLVGIIILLIGLALCFAGYRLFRVILVIWGMLTGFQLGRCWLRRFSARNMRALLCNGSWEGW